jgi:hypothetical protein
MRLLIIGSNEKEAIMASVSHAMMNQYKPGISTMVPGDDPDFVVNVPDGFRCVFTITSLNDTLYRHLSISVPGGKYPSPEASVMLAKEFGFTTSSDSLAIEDRVKDGWMVAMNRTDHCIVLAQPWKGSN